MFVQNYSPDFQAANFPSESIALPTWLYNTPLSAGVDRLLTDTEKSLLELFRSSRPIFTELWRVNDSVFCFNSLETSFPVCLSIEGLLHVTSGEHERKAYFGDFYR